MTLSAQQSMQVMALADGELDGEERAAAEALVSSNDEARRLFEAMGGAPSLAIGEWVAASQIERAVAAGAETIAGAVMDRVANEAPPVKIASVTSLDAARARRAAGVRVAATFAAVAALAAGVLFYVGSEKVTPSGSTTVASAVVTTSASSVPMPSPSALATAEPTFNWSDEPAPTGAGPDPEVTVESTSSHDVSVFHVPASIGAAINTSGSVIVWIGDDKPEGK